MRRPEQCPHRAPTGGDGLAGCGAVARIVGARAADLPPVDPGACEACCRALAPPEDLNPVVASLAFAAAGAVLREGGVPGCDASRARGLRDRLTSHLAVAHPAAGGRAFPPESTPGGGRGWAVGVLTAPRGVPTLGRTLRSLGRAGFGRVRIFAEPGSAIPPEAAGHDLVVNPARLGNFANFANALATLYRDEPGAGFVALFQDDIEAAEGLRAWCDAGPWPEEAGLVSLFTPRAHAGDRPGWRLLRPGFFRIYGGQALVFRRDVLEAFLSDPHVVREVHARRHGDDAVVAAWAARRGLPIAYHTPSLVQHVGAVSSIYEEGPDRRVVADAVASVDRIASWRPAPRRPGKVGLVGWNARTGLGYQNLDLATHLGVDRWLIPEPPWCCDPAGDPPCRADATPAAADPAALRRWLDGLDWVLFVERPCVAGLAEAARERQVGVACVPNWEWLDPARGWLSYVDVMLCPTRRAFAHVSDWSRRYGFGWDVRYVPWPVDAQKFRFRERRRAGRFVFANGWGGGRARRLDGSETPYGRKGLELILAAARIDPRLRFLAYSQDDRLPPLPGNVEVRIAPADNQGLYDEGDVCVQPSHFEGLGLQLLECQAAGMPLVTTAAPPMNEYEPLATVPVVGTEPVFCEGHQPIAAQLMDPRDLARVLRDLSGSDISAASRRARAFVEREHSWARALPMLREALVAL